MLHIWFWSLGDTIVNEIEKKTQHPTLMKRILVEKQNKTSKQKLYILWGCCDTHAEHGAKDLKCWDKERLNHQIQ